MKDNTKTTSKREFRFVIHSEKSTVTIIDDKDQTLRTFSVRTLPSTVQDILIVHGLKQKLTDDTMVSKIGEDGDRLLACDDLWTRLLAGEWEKEREGIARPPEAIVRFVMDKKNIKREVAVASLKAAGKVFWDAVKTTHAEALAAIEKTIAEEKAAGKAVDLTDL